MGIGSPCDKKWMFTKKKENKKKTKKNHQKESKHIWIAEGF